MANVIFDLKEKFLFQTYLGQQTNQKLITYKDESEAPSVKLIGIS
jgi:hypothetical protein